MRLYSVLRHRHHPGFVAVFYFVLFLSVLVATTGCDCRKRTTTHALIRGNQESTDVENARKRDIFDQSLDTLNTLQGTVALPGLDGIEVLSPISDRLHDWIRDRQPEQECAPEELLQKIELSLTKCAGDAAEAVRLLKILRGESATASETDEASPDEVYKRLMKLLNDFQEESNALTQAAQIPDLEFLSDTIEALQKKFTGFESLGTVTPTGIRVFTKQLNNETEMFGHISVRLGQFAQELKQDGIFVQFSDVEYLKQSCWMRHLSHWAGGSRQISMERVKALFDWTVRNIVLRGDSIAISPNNVLVLPQQHAWQTILLGEGTTWDLAVVFIELLRQLRIDACVLAVPHPENPKQTLPWAVGVLLNDELYLFLPAYGTPIPGPGGLQFDAKTGMLDCREVATLKQVLEDDQLLRQLDILNGPAFPLTSESLKETTALLYVTPQSVSVRMSIIELELNAEQNMVLFSNVKEQKRLLGLMPAIKKIDLWSHPIQTISEQLFIPQNTELMLHSRFGVRPPTKPGYPLWTGRILYFNGRLLGQESSITSLLNACISERDFFTLREIPEVRANPVIEQSLRLNASYANYWRGLVSFESSLLEWGKQGDDSDTKEAENLMASAKVYFSDKAVRTNPLLFSGPHIMLGRVAECQKNYDEAVRCYRRLAVSPYATGCLLRAAWIEKLSPASPTAPLQTD